ncbi:hypothetical protein J2R96_005867 [Bradyrhizobium elkanii]|nr:hypothetical protein [Bradyrhizobium elkanii]
MKPLTPEQAFLVDEIWIMAWGASVQRAKLFAKEVEGKADFRTRIIDYVSQELLRHYEQGCTEEQHYKNISDLVEFGAQGLPALLKDGVYKYGVAQKLLNLAMKYYWCLDLIPEPPHCPVDRIVIGKTHLRGKVNWTEIRDEGQYREVIEAIRNVAGRESLARWELINYRRRQPPPPSD